MGSQPNGFAGVGQFATHGDSHIHGKRDSQAEGVRATEWQARRQTRTRAARSDLVCRPRPRGRPERRLDPRGGDRPSGCWTARAREPRTSSTHPVVVDGSTATLFHLNDLCIREIGVGSDMLLDQAADGLNGRGRQTPVAAETAQCAGGSLDQQRLRSHQDIRCLHAW
jgi:hypothetical protein